MANEELKNALQKHFDDRRAELAPEDLAKVTGGGSWYNAPDAPKCPGCGSNDTLTVGFFLMWNAYCRNCGLYFDDTDV